jgi:HlyD family secretion protein
MQPRRAFRLIGPAVLAVALLPAAVLVPGCRGRQAAARPEEFTVLQGSLDITVTESGSLKAAESQSIKSEVKRMTRILEIVDEGVTITEEDVKNGKVLVQLDATEVQESLRQKESSAANAKAQLTVAEEELVITKSTNESAIRTAELNVTFALNELRKLVGDRLAEKYAEQEPADITSLLDDPDLGGQSLQDKKTYQSEIEMAGAECSRAKDKLEWSEKLLTRGYVTANERDGDKLELRRRELAVETADVKLGIFRRYEFVKTFQKQWSDVLEARAKLEREKAQTRSKLAQSQARQVSAAAQERLESDQLARLKQEVEACTIKATKPGLVAFRQPPPWQNEGPLKVGSQVQPNQVIFEMPDISRMLVKVDIQEASIDLAQVGQTAAITVDAVPGATFSGAITKKAVLPNSQQNWLNPDLKVYETEVTIEGKNGSLRPGMTATVEVLCEKLESVVHVPIQAVSTDDKGDHSCYRADGSKVAVKIGKRNQIFVVIEGGLKPGERILMSPPELAKNG